MKTVVAITWLFLSNRRAARLLWPAAVPQQTRRMAALSTTRVARRT